MSLSSALSIALSGLQVATTQMQLTSNNISNAQTPGYAEQSANLSSVVFGGGAGGVTISGYSNASNEALTASYNNATSQASLYNTENNYLGQVQSLLGSNTSNPPLSTALANFQSAWTQFSAAPESATEQQTVIQAGVNLANQIQQIASGVTSLTQQATSDINTTVSSLNTDIANVATLNTQIADAQGAGQPVGALEDQRAQDINAIAAITNVTVLSRPEGQVALYTPGGLLLLDGGTAQSFSYNGTDIVSSAGQTVTSALTGGSLQAEINFLNGSASSSDPGTGVLNKLTTQLTALTASLTTAAAGPPQTFADAYNTATTGTGELASDFFTADAGNDPGSLAVNANLLNGTNTLKEASAAPAATALSAVQSFSAGTLSVSGTYTDFGTAILSGFQQAANTLQTQSTSATQQQSFYQTSLSNATGVNVDTELVNLTTLQNSYAASAHVISTISAMLTDLENVLS